MKSSKTLKVKSLGDLTDKQTDSHQINESKKERQWQSINEKRSVDFHLSEAKNVKRINSNSSTYETIEDDPNCFDFDDNSEEDVDEEEEILYLDQNNQIIRPHDQPCYNPSKETVIDNKRTADTHTLDKDKKISTDKPRTSDNHADEIDTSQGSKIQNENFDTLKAEPEQIVKNKEIGEEFEDLQAQDSLSPSKIFSASGPQYRKKQSKVWAHFEKTSDGAHVICNSCGEMQRFMSNTTNMIRHIEKVHSNKANCAYNEAGRRVKQLRRKVCQRSPVWNYFHRMTDTAKVRCKLCLENYTYSGNTTNLRFHLRTRHPDEYRALDEDHQGSKERRKPEKEDANDGSSMKKLKVDMVIDRQCSVKGEKISVEVCNLESGDLGGPVYVATAPAPGYLI